MYESPVNLIYHDIETQIIQQQEQTILEAIRRYDVVVDKDELIKAMNYDRNQYSKGYKDGVKDVLDKIRAEIEELKNAPPCFDDMFEYKYAVDDVLAIIDKYKAESEEGD